MKARSVFAALVISAGLLFIQAPAEAATYTIPRPVSQAVKLSAKPVVYKIPRPLHKPVQACIVGGKLKLGTACQLKTVPVKTKPGYYTLR